MICIILNSCLCFFAVTNLCLTFFAYDNIGIYFFLMSAIQKNLEVKEV